MDLIAELGQPFAESAVAAEFFAGQTGNLNSRLEAPAHGIEVWIGNVAEILRITLYIQALGGYSVYKGDVPRNIGTNLRRKIARKQMGMPERKSGEEQDFQWDTFYVDDIALTLNYNPDESGVDSIEIAKQT